MVAMVHGKRSANSQTQPKIDNSSQRPKEEIANEIDVVLLHTKIQSHTHTQVEQERKREEQIHNGCKRYEEGEVDF